MPTPIELIRQKHETILHAAGAVFCEHGFEGASMSAITRAAGTSKSTIYDHFGDKAGLFVAFVERECERFIVSLSATLPDDVDTAKVLNEVGRRFVDLLISPIVLALDRIITAEASSFPELAQTLYKAGPERATELLRDWLNTQVGKGRLSIPDTDFAAEQFFMLCQTRIVIRRKLHILDKDLRGKPEHVVQAAVEMFMRAYAPSPSVKKAHSFKRLEG